MERSHSSSEGNICNQVFPSTSKEDCVLTEKKRFIKNLTAVKKSLLEDREKDKGIAQEERREEKEEQPNLTNDNSLEGVESDKDQEDESVYEEAEEGADLEGDTSEKGVEITIEAENNAAQLSQELSKKEQESTDKSSDITSTPDAETDVTSDENNEKRAVAKSDEDEAHSSNEESETEYIFEENRDSNFDREKMEREKPQTYFPLIIEDPFSHAKPSMRYISNDLIELFHGDRRGTFEVLRVKNSIELDYNPQKRLLFTCIDKESEDEVTTAAFLDSQRYSIYGTLNGHINMLRATAHGGETSPRFYERKHIYSISHHPIMHTAINNIDAGFICATYQNQKTCREELLVLDLVRQLNIVNPTIMATYDLNYKETFLDIKWSWNDSSNIILSLSKSLRVIDLRVDTNLARTLFTPFRCPLVAPSKFREELFAAVGDHGDKYSIMMFDVRKLTCPLTEYTLIPKIQKDGVDSLQWHPSSPFELMYSSRKHSFIGTLNTQSCQPFASVSKKDKGDNGRHKKMSGNRVWDIHLQDAMYRYEEEKFRNSYYPISEKLIPILGYNDQYSEAQINGKELPLILNLPMNRKVQRNQEEIVVKVENPENSNKDETFSSEEEFAVSMSSGLKLSISDLRDLADEAENWDEGELFKYMLAEIKKSEQPNEKILDEDEILLAKLFDEDLNSDEEDAYYAEILNKLRKIQEAEAKAGEGKVKAMQEQGPSQDNEPLEEIPVHDSDKPEDSKSLDLTEEQCNMEPWKSQDLCAIIPVRPRANNLDRIKVSRPRRDSIVSPILEKFNEKKEEPVINSPSVYGSPMENPYPPINSSDVPSTSQTPGSSSIFGTPDQPDTYAYEQEPSVDLPGTSSMDPLNSFSPGDEGEDQPWHKSSLVANPDPERPAKLITEIRELKRTRRQFREEEDDESQIDTVASINQIITTLKNNINDDGQSNLLRGLPESPSPTDDFDSDLSKLATKFYEEGNSPLGTIEEFSSEFGLNSMGSSVTSVSSIDDLENNSSELLKLLKKRKQKERSDQEKWLVLGNLKRNSIDVAEISKQTKLLASVGEIIDKSARFVNNGLRRLSDVGSNLFSQKKSNDLRYFEEPDFDFMKGLRLEKLEIDPKIYMRLNRVTPAKFNKYNYRFLRSATNPLLLDHDSLGTLLTKKPGTNSETDRINPFDFSGPYKCVWDEKSESGLYGVWDPIKILRFLKVNKGLRVKVLKMLDKILPSGTKVSFETLQIIGKFVNNQLTRMYFEKSDYEKQYGNRILDNKIYGFETVEDVVTFAIPPNGLKGVLYATNSDEGRILYSPPAIIAPEEFTTWQYSRTLEKMKLYEIHSTTDIYKIVRFYETIACWQKSPLLFSHQDYLLSIEMRDTQEEKKHTKRKAALEGDSDCSDEEMPDPDAISMDSYINTVRKPPPLVYHAGEWVYWTRKNLDFYEGPIDNKFLKRLLLEYKKIWKRKIKQRKAEVKAALTIADRLQKEAMMKEMEKREAELRRLNLFSPRNSYVRLSSPRLQEVVKEKEYHADDEVAGDFMTDGMDRDEEEDEERITFGTPDDRSRGSTSRSVATTAGSTPFGTPKERRSAHHSKRGSLTNPGGTPEEIGSYGHRKRSRPIPIGSLYADIAQEYTGKTPQELMDETEEGMSFKRLFADSPKSGDKKPLLTPEGRSPRNVAEHLAAKKRYAEEQAKNSSENKTSTTSPYSESESEKIEIGSSMEKSDQEVPTQEVFQISKKTDELGSLSLTKLFGLCEKDSCNDYLKVLDTMKRMESEGGELSDKTVEEEEFPDNDTPTKEKISDNTSRNLSSLRGNLFGEHSEAVDSMPKKNALPILARFTGKISPLAQYDKSGMISGKGSKPAVSVTRPEGARKFSVPLQTVPENQEKEKEKKKSKVRGDKKEKSKPIEQKKADSEPPEAIKRKSDHYYMEKEPHKRMGRLDHFLATGKVIKKQHKKQKKSSNDESEKEEAEQKPKELLSKGEKVVAEEKLPHDTTRIPSPPDAEKTLNAVAEVVRKLVQNMSTEEMEEVPTLQPKCFEGRDNYKINPKDYPGLANPSGPPIGLVELRSKPMLEPMPDPERPKIRQRVYSSVMAKPTSKEPESVPEMRQRVHSDVSINPTMQRKYGVSELAKPKLEDLLSTTDSIKESDETGASLEPSAFGKGHPNHVFVDLPPPKPPQIMKKKKPKTPKTLKENLHLTSPKKKQHVPWTFFNRPSDIEKINVEFIQETVPRKPSPDPPFEPPSKLPEFEVIHGVPNVPPQAGYSLAPDEKRTKIYADSDEKYEALRTDAPGKLQELTYEMAGMEAPKKKPLNVEELKDAAANLIKQYAPQKSVPAKKPHEPQRKLSNILEKPESPDPESKKDSQNYSFSDVPLEETSYDSLQNDGKILRLKEKCPIDQDNYEDYKSPYPAKYNADSLLYRTSLELNKYERQQKAGYDLSLECHNVKSFLRDMSEYSKDAREPYTPEKIEAVDQSFYYEEVDPPKEVPEIPLQTVSYDFRQSMMTNIAEEERGQEKGRDDEGSNENEKKKKPSRREFTARSKKSESTQSESVEQGIDIPPLDLNNLDYDYDRNDQLDSGFRPSGKYYSEEFESIPPSANEIDLEDILQIAEIQPRPEEEHAMLLNILYKEKASKKKTIKKSVPKTAPRRRRRTSPQKDMSLRSAGFITLDSDGDHQTSSNYYDSKWPTQESVIKSTVSKKEQASQESLLKAEKIRSMRLDSIIQRTIETESEIEDVIIVNKKPKLRRIRKPRPKPWSEFQKYLYPLPVNRYYQKYKIKRGEMDFNVKGVPGILQLMIHESDNDFDISEMSMDTTSFIHLKMYVGQYRERMLYGYHLAHQDHDREYTDPETEYGFFSRMFICFMQGKINEFLRITEKLYDWITGLPEHEKREEIIPFIVKMVYVYQDFCDYIHHYRGTDDEQLKSETKATKNEFLKKLDQVTIECIDFFEEHPILQVIFLLMKLEVLEEEQPNDYAEFFVGVKNFPTRLLVLFVCRVCTTLTLKHLLPKIFAQIEGIDRLPFVGIGHHYDTYAVLADYYDKTGDYQQVAHCLIAGRTLEEEDYYVRFLYKLLGYEDWDMEKPIHIEPEFRTDEMPDHLFEYPFHIDIFRLEDFFCFDSEDPEHPFNQLCRLWKRDSPGGFGRVLAYLSTKGRIPPVYYADEIYKDRYIVSTESFETYYEICQQIVRKYLNYLNAVDPITQHCLYEEVFNHGFRDTEIESTAIYRRILIEKSGNNALQSSRYPPLQIMPSCEYCGKSRKEAEIIRKKADEEELLKLQEAERTGKGKKVGDELLEVEPAPGIDDVNGSMICSEMEAKACPISACQNCRKPNPRCIVCHSIEGTMYDADLGRFEELEDHWVLCVRCQHGGHAVHLSEWFAKQKKCAACDCECNRTDIFQQLVKWDMEDKGYLPAVDFNY